MVEYLPCLGETLTSVSSPEKIEKKKGRNENEAGEKDRGFGVEEEETACPGI